MFNALTGSRQHTGNWSGKTVANAYGAMRCGNTSMTLVDLPGTYSLRARSAEERAARDFLASGEADVTILVADATCLERNLILVLQVLEITSRAVLCLNLMDEARRKHIRIDIRALEHALGIPVVPCAARQGRGLPELTQAVRRVLEQGAPVRTATIRYPDGIENAIQRAGLPRAAALDALVQSPPPGLTAEQLDDQITAAAALRAEEIALCCVQVPEAACERDRRIDRILLSRRWGVPLMLACWPRVLHHLIRRKCAERVAERAPAQPDRTARRRAVRPRPAAVCRLAAHGRSVARAGDRRIRHAAADGHLFPAVHPARGRGLSAPGRFPARPRLPARARLRQAKPDHVHGIWMQRLRRHRLPHHRLAPRAADRHAHQRIRAVQRAFPAADLPVLRLFRGQRRGRRPLLLTAVIAGSVALTLAASRLLSATVLKGVPSSFVLELPPYRAPQVGKVIVRNLLDRTLFVLSRAAAVAAPAGMLIWLLANITIGETSIFSHLTALLDPFARQFGLDGVILLAFLLGFPANELVMPLMMMGYLAAGTLADVTDLASFHALLLSNGWTACTALCTLVFTIAHWPCSTTCLTIWRETHSVRWTLAAILLPAACGLALCFVIHAVCCLLGIA